MKPTYKELCEAIEKEGCSANNVNCLLNAIYGENVGNKLFHEWMKGVNNEAHFHALVDQQRENEE